MGVCGIASIPRKIENVFEIRLIERVHPREAVLSAGGVTLSVRVESDAVDRAEMSFDSAELFLENHVKKSGIELAVSGGSGRHFHGVLSSA